MYKFLCKLKRQILQFDTKSLNKKRYTLLASKLIATKIFIFFHQNKKSQIRYLLKRFFFFKKVIIFFHITKTKTLQRLGEFSV